MLPLSTAEALVYFSIAQAEKTLRTQWGYQAEAGAICPFTAYQGAETLNIYIIWICEAL